MLKISALCLRSLERFCGGSRTAIRLRTGGRPSKGIAPLQRGILDLSNTGSRNWSGPDMKEAQSTIHDIVQAQVESINHVVPWFLTNMPVCAAHTFCSVAPTKYTSNYNLHVMRMFAGSVLPERARQPAYPSREGHRLHEGLQGHRHVDEDGVLRREQQPARVVLHRDGFERHQGSGA
jgi:hypothetical protein